MYFQTVIIFLQNVSIMEKMGSSAPKTVGFRFSLRYAWDLFRRDTGEATWWGAGIDRKRSDVPDGDGIERDVITGAIAFWPWWGSLLSSLSQILSLIHPVRDLRDLWKTELTKRSLYFHSRCQM